MSDYQQMYTALRNIALRARSELYQHNYGNAERLLDSILQIEAKFQNEQDTNHSEHSSTAYIKRHNL